MTQPIPSPLQFQALQRQHAEKALMVKMMADLLRVHQQFMDKLAEVDRTINKKIGPKGDAGHTPTEQELSKLIKPFIDQHLSDASLLRLIKPLIPNVKNGNTPTADDLIALIKPLIPKVRHGKDAVVDIDKIAEKVALLIKPEQIETDPLKIIDQIMGLPEGKKLKTKHIDGFEQTVQSMFHQMARGYLHGGGDTVRAGTGVTITSGSDGTKTISTTTTPDTPADWVEVTPFGLINGSNVTYYLPTTPTSGTLTIYANTAPLLPGNGYTISGQTITFDTALQGDITFFKARYIPDTSASPEVLTLNEPSLDSDFQFYASSTWAQDRPIIFTCHGTAETYIQQMGHDTPGIKNFGGEPDWSVLSETYDFMVVSVDFEYDGNTHSNSCYAKLVYRKILAVVDYLEDLGWIGSVSVTPRHITGYSSGAGIAADMGLLYADVFSKSVQRHNSGPSYAAATAADTVANFTNGTQKLRNFNWDAPGGGTCNVVGSAVDTYNWITDVSSHQHESLILNGETDDNNSAVGNRYKDQQAIILECMETYGGYSTSRSTPAASAKFVHKVFSAPANLVTNTCLIGGVSAEGTTNYPHACHAQDKEYAAIFLAGTDAQRAIFFS